MGNSKPKVEYNKPVYTFLNLYFFGEDYSTLLFTQEGINYQNGVAKLTHPELQWCYFLYQPQGNSIEQSIKSEIVKQCQVNKLNNIVICVLNSIRDPRLVVLLKKLSSFSEIDRPSIILVINEEDPMTTMSTLLDQNGLDYDEDLICQVKNNIDEIKTTLIRLCAYYNKLDDKFFVNETEQVVATDLTSINILIIGQPGTGKSTFINNFMGEKRSLDKKGVACSDRIIAYHHKKEPIVLFDTPGFQKSEDQIKVINLIEEHQKLNEEKKYDSIHLILFFMNAATRFCQNQETLFLQNLMKFKIKIVILLTHCENDDQGNNLKQILKNELRHLNIYNPEILFINLVKPKKGYQNLYESIYRLFVPYQVINREIKKNLEKGALQTVLSTNLKATIFFNYINDSSCWLKRMNNKSNDLIRSFTKTQYVRYLFSFLPFSFSDLEFALVKRIGTCYAISISNSDITGLLNSLNIPGLIKNIIDDEVKNLQTMNQFVNFIQRINGYRDIDMELFRTVYEEASPYLAKEYCLARYKKYAIAYAMLGYKIKTHFQSRLTGAKLIGTLIKGIDNYSQGVDYLKTKK